MRSKFLLKHGNTVSLEEALLKVMYDFSEVLVAQGKRGREAAVSKTKRKPRSF